MSPIYILKSRYHKFVEAYEARAGIKNRKEVCHQSATVAT
jgi:hypothetical protein